MVDLTIRNGDVALAATLSGPAGAPAVLFLHGLSASRDTWAPAVTRLGDRYRSLAVDFRGHGHSDRASSYVLEDYVGDALAALEFLAQPSVVIGHSLGAVTAGVLGQREGGGRVKGVLLEDPPWYLGEKSEWDKGIYRTIFPMIRDEQVALQAAGAPFGDYLEFVSNAPSMAGGTAADHHEQSELESFASSLQRHDPACWEAALDLSLFATLDSAAPVGCPALVLQADANLGPALMPGHERRFQAANPDAEIVLHDGAGHRIHSDKDHQQRVLDQVELFVASTA
ncbi:MAG: alpha/beta fold hydrolase [Acidimicrobiales bacterium]